MTSPIFTPAPELRWVQNGWSVTLRRDGSSLIRHLDSNHWEVRSAGAPLPIASVSRRAANRNLRTLVVGAHGS